MTFSNSLNFPVLEFYLAFARILPDFPVLEFYLAFSRILRDFPVLWEPRFNGPGACACNVAL